MLSIFCGLIMAIGLNNHTLFDFSKDSNTESWQVVNDGVMGGLSEATFKIGENGIATFKGRISLENNGGFSSVRYNTGETNVEGYSSLVLRLKGDGKKYQVSNQAETQSNS